ncbi:hypothetical protein BDD12DRAFT_888302 [Trichophaea hybrida]|nr:hypothetical protein BDD12DRAFT_888302 [Trichophaea hybrida]
MSQAHQPEVSSPPPVRPPAIHHQTAPPNQLYNPATQSYILGAGHADFEAHNRQLDMQAQANLQAQHQFFVHRQPPSLPAPPPGIPAPQPMSFSPYTYGYASTGSVQYYGSYPPRSGSVGPGVWYGNETQHSVMGLYGQQQVPQKNGWASVTHSQLQSLNLASAEELDESSSTSLPPSPTPIASKRAVPANPSTVRRATKRRRNSSIDQTYPPLINPSAPAFIPGGYEFKNQDNICVSQSEKETYDRKMERWLDMDDDEFVYVTQLLSQEQTRAMTDAQAAC